MLPTKKWICWIFLLSHPRPILHNAQTCLRVSNAFHIPLKCQNDEIMSAQKLRMKWKWLYGRYTLHSEALQGNKILKLMKFISTAESSARMVTWTQPISWSSFQPPNTIDVSWVAQPHQLYLQTSNPPQPSYSALTHCRVEFFITFVDVLQTSWFIVCKLDFLASIHIFYLFNTV
jgi:hypothetical protein